MGDCCDLLVDARKRILTLAFDVGVHTEICTHLFLSLIIFMFGMNFSLSSVIMKCFWVPTFLFRVLLNSWSKKDAVTGDAAMI